MLASGFISVVISIEKALSGKALASKEMHSSYIFVIDISDESQIRHHHSSIVPFDFDVS